MICPTCHMPITPGMDFCLHCGTEVRGAAAALEDSAPGLPVPPPAPHVSTPLHAEAGPVVAPAAASSLPPLLYAPRLPWRLRLLGPSADPTRAVPYSRAQVWLRRAVGQRNATRPWLTAVGGALVALVASLALMLPGAWMGQNGLAAVGSLTSAYIPAAGEIGLESAPLLACDPIKLLLLALHVPIDYTYAIGAEAGITSHVTLSLPLTGLLLLPALALTLGGYLSAASEYGRVPRYAILRGALIGPLYGALLFPLALIAARSPAHIAALANLSLAPLPAWALFYGTLWGALFGALGGWLHVSGRAWLAAALPVLRGVGAPRVMGALAGAGAALLCGLLLYLAVGLGVAAFTSVHATFLPSVSGLAGSSPGVSVARQGQPLIAPGPALVGATVAGVVVLGVPLAFWLLALGSGAAWEAAATGVGVNQSWSLGFVGAQHTLPQVALPLAVVPVVSYLVGGRIAARVAGADRRETAFAAGAAMSVPLAILFSGMAWLVTASLQPNSGVGVAERAGPSIAGTAIATLLAGGLVGGIGGLSALRAPWLGQLSAWPLAPVRFLGRPLLPLLDRLTGHADDKSTSLARRWLYDAVLVALALGVLVLVADAVTLAQATPNAFQRMRVVDGLLAALLVSLPLLCGLAALISAFTATERTEFPAFGAPLRMPVYLAVPRPASPASEILPVSAATPLPVIPALSEPPPVTEPLARGQPRDYEPPARRPLPRLR